MLFDISLSNIFPDVFSGKGNKGKNKQIDNIKLITCTVKKIINNTTMILLNRRCL